MTPIDEVERFFRQLVDVLSESDPDRLSSPIQISELYQSIIPYRHHRAALGFDTNEDYEMAVLRFLAGEGGFASLDPPEVQQALMEHAQAINPTPGAFREFAAAKVYLNSGAVRTVTQAYEAYAPPTEPEVADHPEEDGEAEAEEPEVEEPIPEPPAIVLAEEDDLPEAAPPAIVAAEPAAESACRHCARDLPTDREVHFCPYCGRDTNVILCSSCGTELELGWQFCITCGDPVEP